jgi:hypothetical protein
VWRYVYHNRASTPVIGNSAAGNSSRPVKSQASGIAVVLPTSTGTAFNCRSGSSAVLAVHNTDCSTISRPGDHARAVGVIAALLVGLRPRLTRRRTAAGA